MVKVDVALALGENMLAALGTNTATTNHGQLHTIKAFVVPPLVCMPGECNASIRAVARTLADGARTPIQWFE